MEPETNTHVASTKKLIRQEKKKKKMLAYLEVAKLNDLDRIKTEVNTENDLSDCSFSEDEPSSKKAKTEDLDFIENNNITENVNGVAKFDVADVGLADKVLTGDDYAKLKQELRLRKTKLKNMPRINLKDAGNTASLSVSPEDRIPLFLSDIQHLILFALLNNSAPYTPHRWCQLDRPTNLTHTVVLVLENFSLNHYSTREQYFPTLSECFTNKFEIVTPSVYRGDLIEEVAAVPITSTLKSKLLREYGTISAAVQSSKVFNMIKAVFPVKAPALQNQIKYANLPVEDKFPRTHILLSAWQLVEASYPLPLKGILSYKYFSYILTKDTYDEVTPSSPMYGLDCEMCKTTTGELELTRVSIVNEKHEAIYDKLVQPYNRITNYLTQYSGITASMLKNVTYRLEDVQRDLRDMLPADAILVGQSLNSDLHALKMMHPYVIDTSVIFNLTGDRCRKTKLKVLAEEFLDEKIQRGSSGHSPIEDSLSSLKLAQVKLAHSIEYGDAILSGQKGCLRKTRNIGGNYYGTSLLHHITKIDKKAVVVGKADSIMRYKKYIHETDAENKIESVVKESNESIVKFVLQNTGDLSLAHITVQDADLAENTIQATCESIDKSVRRIWSSLANNTLCIVLFGGETGGNGACFVQVKTNARTANSYK